MGQDHDLEFREQIYIVGVSLFLISFAVSLYRNQSLGWASVAATGALMIVVLAGWLLTSFIRLEPSVAEEPGAQAAQGATAQPGQHKQQGKRFDCSLDESDSAA